MPKPCKWCGAKRGKPHALLCSGSSKKKPETAAQREKRLERNRRARERHWKRTGVSDATVQWMKDGGTL